MPIYEYKCDDCGFVTEVLQKVTEGTPAECEYCGESNLSKLMSKSSFRLKGTDWYSPSED